MTGNLGDAYGANAIREGDAIARSKGKALDDPRTEHISECYDGETTVNCHNGAGLILEPRMSGGAGVAPPLRPFLFCAIMKHGGKNGRAAGNSTLSAFFLHPIELTGRQ